MNEPEIFFTVKQLVEVLKTFHEDMPVLVSGYKNGFDNFYLPEMVKLTYKPENMEWDGQFQVPIKNEASTLTAVILQRVFRND